MIERIRELCAKNGTNLANLEKALGFANGSLAKSDGKMQSARLKAVADYFGVTMEYILQGEKSYYLNPEISKKAQELFDDPDMSLLFEAAKGNSPDNLRMAAEMLKKFKETNPNG